MKGLLKIIFVAFVILGFSTVHSSPSTTEQIIDKGDQTTSNGEQSFSGLDETATKIASLFPTVEGKILSTEGNTVRIHLGKRNGISSQMRLAIIREGKEFFHPVTKVVMGRFETSLGLLEIKEVMEETSLGLIIEQKEEIKIGDMVRITSGRIRVAFIFSEGTDRDTLVAFYEALEGTGRFRILEDEKVTVAMEKDGLKKIDTEAKEEIKRLGRALDLEGIIFLEIRPTHQGAFFKADLIHTFDGNHLGTYEAFAPSYQKKDVEFPLPERRDYWKAFDFDYRARLLGVGDLDGDGRSEIVTSDGTRIRIYRFEDSNLVEVWSDKDSKGDNHIAIDVADINRDGKAEIFITNYGDSLNSFVIEYRDNDYKRIWDKVPLFFRVTNIPGKGETLLAQGLDGNTHEYFSKERGYIKGNSIKLPASVEIYGFTFVDWGERGHYQILSIDEDDYLNLYSSDGERMWRSKDRYGGYVLSFERPHWIIENKMEKVRIKGRIITRDYGDGRQKAITIRNIPITYIFRDFRGYKEAEVFSFSWNGSEIVEEWRIDKLNGFIADYGVGDLAGNGKENLCLILNHTLMAGKSILMPGLRDVISGKSRLLLYNLPKR